MARPSPSLRNRTLLASQGQRSRTFGAVIDDILAEQVIVTKHHRGVQLGQVLLQPGKLPFQHLCLRDICRKAGQGRERWPVEGRLTVDRQVLGFKSPALWPPHYLLLQRDAVICKLAQRLPVLLMPCGYSKKLIKTLA